ncbi:hypothetical protein C0Q70_10361 [Pomacea canaliculata]|uniref:Uncharacterized protein n=1 Tax=Pomacea canaliculata TaxID=400727 RepID=A0A2T7PCD9_POMCA|nr:hypothetical protein C0Q70_10361 [Pomacea canaliculata]
MDGGSSGKKSEQIDAILCIAGIDSRYNEGCYELINYLLFGFFDVRRAELEKSGFPEEVVDDLIIVIRKNRVDIYCNPINWHYFLPYTSHWINVTYHCLQDEEYNVESEEGAQHAEEFKIQSLISMTHGCQFIGVPYYSLLSYDQKFDKMMVEKWPIIQAFALDDYSGKGFFTLRFDVLDVSKSVHKFYGFLDPVSVEILVTEGLPMLERQWDNMCDNISLKISNGIAVINQKGIAEGLDSFYQHGRVGNHRHESGNFKEPYVLFGNSSNQDILVAMQTGKQAPDCQLHLSKIQSVAHMICRVTSPRYPITCTRTYFFSQLFTDDDDPANERKATSSGGGSQDAASKRAELRYLVTVYAAMVNGVMRGIQAYSQSALVAKAQQEALEALVEGCHSIMTSALKGCLSNRSKVVFSIEMLHRDGSVSEVVDGQHNTCAKVATMTLYDIPASQLDACSPGSLVFSECFLDSFIPLADLGMSSTVNYDVLYITSHIPRYRLWGVTANTGSDHKALKSKIESNTARRMGSMLMSGDQVDLTSSAFVTLPPETVSLYVYKHGLTLYSDSYGSFSLLAADCSKLQLFDGDSTVTAVLLIITYHTWSAVKLPPHLVAPDKMLVIVFPPRSKAHTHLFGEVLRGWKEDSQMPQVNRLQREELPDRLKELYGYLQQVHKNSGWQVNPSAVISLKDAVHNLPHLPKFLTHLTATVSVNTPVQRSDLLHLIEREPAVAVSSSNDQVVVTILTGVPGSEKETLCSHLTTIGKDHIRWTVVSQIEQATLDVVQLHRMLSSAVTSHLQQDANLRQTRVLLVAPGFVNTPDVVSAILRHPEAKVRSSLKIGAITACIDPLNTFMQNRMTLPMLLNQCAQGWVNNIIFTSQTKAPSALLDTIQSMIRSLNVDVALLLAENGEVKRSTDLDQVLSDTAFDEPAMIRARILLFSGWKVLRSPSAQCPLDMNDIILRFSRPLEKARLLQRLKALPKTLSKFPFEGNVYYIEGYVLFSDVAATVDIRYTTLSQNLILRTQASSQRPSSEGSTRTKLISCLMCFACLSWQKPEKKKRLGISDLTQKEINNVHKERHLEPLPPGWFYNGTQFVSMSGERSATPLYPFYIIKRTRED